MEPRDQPIEWACRMHFAIDREVSGTTLEVPLILSQGNRGHTHGFELVAGKDLVDVNRQIAIMRVQSEVVPSAVGQARLVL